MEDNEEESPEEELPEHSGLTSSEEAFMRGYLDDDNETAECTECGCLLDEATKPLKKEIDEEELLFCSKSCLEDYRDSF